MSGPGKERDVFDPQVAMNARLSGEYHDIAENVGKCVFCDLREKYIVTEREGMVLTVNLFPYLDGHMMVIPRRHIEDFSEISESEWLEIRRLSQIGRKLLQEAMGIEGVWFILRDGQLGIKSGKTVKHLHWNIMPYQEGLNTWNYQTPTIKPVDLAEKLRNYLNDERDQTTTTGTDN